MQEKTGNVTLTYEDGADRLEQIPFEDRQIHSLVKEVMTAAGAANRAGRYFIIYRICAPI